MKYPAHIVEQIFMSVIENASVSSKRVGKKIFRGRCPKCGDSKRKKNKARFYCLESNSHWTVHCHNCEYSTNFEKMLEEFHPEHSHNLKFLCIDQIKNGEIFKRSVEEEDKRIEPTDAIDRHIRKYLRQNCISLSEPQTKESLEKFRRFAIANLTNRKIPQRFIDEFYFCYRGDKDTKKYVWRIIIPFKTSDGRIYNFQARDIHPKPTEGRLDTKYIFAEFSDIILPDQKIYRYDQISKNRTVYICEGILDSLFIENAIALCNANVSGDKADFIRERVSDRVWVLDSPWVDNTGYERICKLLEMGETCFVIPKEYKFENGEYPKDINDLAKILGVETIPMSVLNAGLLSGKAGLIKLKVLKMGK